MLKVLLVDDEPVILEGLSMMIDWEQEGLKVVGTAPDGMEALRMIRQLSPDIVITDIKMPRMTGLELLERVREKEKEQISFIVLTGFDDFSYARRALKLEAVDYLLKPVEKKELLTALKKASLICEAIDRSKKTDTDLQKEVLFHNIISLINGKSDSASLNSIKQYLGRLTGVRYISIELNENNEVIAKATVEEKRRMQKLMYSACLDNTEDEYRVLFDVSLRGSNYDVGFIYSDELLHDGISEKEYFAQLRKSIDERLGFPVVFIPGRKVDSLADIAVSCKSVAMADSLREWSAYEDADEAKLAGFINSGLAVDKNQVDELVKSVTRNRKEDILRQAASLVDTFQGMENRFISMVIDYLIFGLIGTAKELDSQIDQEEVLRYISDSVYEEIELKSDSENLSKILVDYAEYLDELRSSNSAGILKNIEDDIRENYRENLTLKELGAKYYINASYLGQLFKAKYGTTFKSFLHHIRIEKAEDLLINSDMKMYSIAEAVGYKDTDYFIDHFIAEKGCTPSKYRKEINKNKKI
ncbi:MAG: response regulator [Lachnospiraceae bacterium]|nr:response regulator [Lachnospiraceae bacterium]